MNKQVFRKIFNVIALDKDLKKASALRLYVIMRAIANMDMHGVIITIGKCLEKNITENSFCDRIFREQNIIKRSQSIA